MRETLGISLMRFSSYRKEWRQLAAFFISITVLSHNRDFNSFFISVCIYDTNKVNLGIEPCNSDKPIARLSITLDSANGLKIAKGSGYLFRLGNREVSTEG